MNPHFFTAPFCFAFVSAMKMYSHIAAFPSRGRCPAGADRVTMV